MSWLTKWFKKDLPKSQSISSVSSLTTAGSNYITNGTIGNTLPSFTSYHYPGSHFNTSSYTNFQSYMEQAIQLEKENIEAAKIEIAKFEPLTQQILKDLEDAGLITSHPLSTIVPNNELQALAIGKIIDPQVKNALFTKKLEDTINE